MDYLDEDNEMHFTDPDEEDRMSHRSNKNSIFDKLLRKNSSTGGNSMPVGTRISELSNIADLSQEDALSADRRAKRPAESSGMASSYTAGQTSQALDGADQDSTFN